MLKLSLPLLMLSALSTLAVPMYTCQNVRVKDRYVEIAPKGTIVGAMDVKGGADAVTVKCFEDRLTVSFGEVFGEHAVTITKDKDNGKLDTAWELCSVPFAVTPGKAFVLRVRARGNIMMRVPKPYRGNYNTAVRWFGKDGKTLEGQDFVYGFETAPQNWQDTYREGTVPAGAATAMIMVGADHPDVALGEVLHISCLELMEKGTCGPEASFVSSPRRMQAGGSLNWEADCPKGAALRFRIATAPDRDGVPGPWSSFHGPDGKAESAFTQPGMALSAIPAGHEWVRYQCVMVSSADGRSPILKSVSLCGKTDKNWTVGNNNPPVLYMVSSSPNPDPEMVLRFRLESDSVVDPKSLAFSIDGKEALAGLMLGEDGVYSYVPQTHWTALPVAADPSKWMFSGSGNKEETRCEPLAGNVGGVRIFSDLDKGDTFFRLTSPYVQVTAGTSYTLDFQEHHDLDIHPGIKHYNKIEWFDGQMKHIGQDAIFPHARKALEWTRIHTECTAPEKAVCARVTIGFDTPNIYKGHYFELGNVHFTGPDGEQVQEAYNVHTARISGKDIDGQKFNESCAFFIGEPRKENIISMRDDGFMLVDGKPFFPIGIAGFCKREFNGMSLEKGLQDLKSIGFNFVSSYAQGDALEEYLTVADAYGIYGYVSAIKDTANVIMRFRHHKSAFSWYIGDDTSMHIPHDVLRDTHRLCHALDNSRQTSQADVVNGSNYTRYVHSTDVFRPELYPMHDEMPDPREVPEIIQDMKTIWTDIEHAGSPVKSIWGIVQYFDGWKGWKRFPTRQELRAMSWLAIIHGAHGITWYTYGGFGDNHGITSTPERWENMGSVSREIAALQHELTNRHAPVQPTVRIMDGPTCDALGYPSVSCLLKSDSDVKNKEGVLLLTASSSVFPVRARITLPGHFKKATALSENRVVTITDNVLEESYEPYGVHLYRLK